MITIEKYQKSNGKIPFDDWLNKLKDLRAKSQILVRLNRLRLGNEGDWKSVGEGVRELRISEGKGYRIYYAWQEQNIVILFCGGDKSTQAKDITTAQQYWRNYSEQ